MTAEAQSSYYERRAEAERAAATKAGCCEAQRAHLELAALYMQLASGQSGSRRAEEPAVDRPRLVILDGK